LRASAARSAEARTELPKIDSRDLVLMAQQCPRSAGLGKPLRLVDQGEYIRKPVSVIVTNAGIAVIEQFDLRVP
jgi:hypothetical protein